MPVFLEINDAFSQKKLSIFVVMKGLENLLSESIFQNNKD